MRIRDLTDRAVMEAIEGFFQDCNRFVDSVSRVLSNHPYSLLRRPRRLGISEFPFFYAVDLYQLFDFARGRTEMSPALVEERCDQLLALLHTTIGGTRVEADWDALKETPLGLCILACGARLSLRRADTISAQEVMLLADWSDKHLSRSGLTLASSPEEPRFDSEAVRALFAEAGVAV